MKRTTPQRCGRCRQPGHIANTCPAPRPVQPEDVCTCRTRRSTSEVALRPCDWHRKYRAEKRKRAA